ncbi:hypothetical protein Tco_0193947 [Tanacetum coccineum]
MKKDEREWKGKVLTIGFLNLEMKVEMEDVRGFGIGVEDVIGEDDCDDDDCDEEMSLVEYHLCVLHLPKKQKWTNERHDIVMTQQHLKIEYLLCVLHLPKKWKLTNERHDIVMNQQHFED